MEDNLARELEMNQNVQSQPFEHPHERKEPSVERIPQDIPISKGLTTLEWIMIAAISLTVFSLVLLNISADIQVTKINKEIQDVTSETEQIQFENENLTQHSHELSRYDRIYKIAEEYGLELHEENIKNITSIE